MIENVCYVCYTELEDDKATCHVCGMPRLKVIGENADAKRMIEKIADEHRHNKLGDTAISFLAYEYENIEGVLKEKTSHKIEIAKAIDLIYDETIWLKEKFAGIESSRTMELTVAISRHGSVVKNAKIRFKAPMLADFWSIGVKMIDGFCIVFRIGNPDIYTETESISLI